MGCQGLDVARPMDGGMVAQIGRGEDNVGSSAASGAANRSKRTALLDLGGNGSNVSRRPDAQYVVYGGERDDVSGPGRPEVRRYEQSGLRYYGKRGRI